MIITHTEQHSYMIITHIEKNSYMIITHILHMHVSEYSFSIQQNVCFEEEF